MLTLERCRDTVAIYGPSCLDYMSKDIQDAMRMAILSDNGWMLSDMKRQSEYADELCIVAQVRREIQGKPCCPTCGRVNP